MKNYITHAQQIVCEYWNTYKRIEQQRSMAKERLRLKIIGEEGYSRAVKQLNEREATAKSRARAQLDALRGEVYSRINAWATPSGAAVAGDDYKLLSSGYPLTLDEYKALCTRHRDNYTMQGYLLEYGKQHHMMAYAVALCPTAEKRKAAFDSVYTRAVQDLNAAGAGFVVASSPALWDGMTGDAAKTLGPLVNGPDAPAVAPPAPPLNTAATQRPLPRLYYGCDPDMF